MDLTTSLAAITTLTTVSAVAGYFLIRRKFEKELKNGIVRQEELGQKVYEAEVLREIGDRIGYSLDATKIIEIISSSLGKLLPYSTVSYLIVGKNNQKTKFACQVAKPIGPNFVREVKGKMLAAFSEMSREPIVDTDVDESISGGLIDERLSFEVGSFFNLPFVIGGKLVSIINVAAEQPDQYNEKNTEVLYRISKHAADAVSKLHEVLENEKNKLSQAVESLSDGILICDNSYKLILINDRLQKLLGVTERATILDVVHALSGQVDLRTLMEAANISKVDSNLHEAHIKNKVLQVYASRVVDKKTDKTMGIVVSFHDVTDTRALERLRSDFMTTMVHELRSPLTTIKSTVEMILEDPKSVDEKELLHHLQIVDSTSQTMLTLVNDLLDVAKMEAGKFDVVSEPGNLDEFILDRVENYKAEAEAKGLKLTAIIEPYLPKAYFDKIRIKQVLNNLISNAIKYSDAGNITIKVSQRMVNNHSVDILIGVTDNGVGIEPEEAKKLFSKYSQLSGGRTKAGLKSTGLGLFIAKGIVETIGGKIWVESPGPGLGSTFFFTVPLASEYKEEDKNEEPIVFLTKKVAQA